MENDELSKFKLLSKKYKNIRLSILVKPLLNLLEINVV